MTMEVETLIAVSLMMAVFSAVAAVGTSIVLGAGFERLRSGFEVIRKQTGFFSDAIHKLEKKVEVVDGQANAFSQSMNTMEKKIANVGDQASAFSGSVQALEKKVEIANKQTGFFSQAIQKLDKKVDTINKHEAVVSKKMADGADNDLISAGKAEALVSHAETLLGQVGALAIRMTETQDKADTRREKSNKASFSVPQKLHNHLQADQAEIRYH